MIKSHDMGGFRERHTKLTNDGVKLLLDEKLQLADQAVDRINRWSGIQMRNIDMRKFATDALLMRLGEDRQPEEHEIRGILEAHRDSDNKNTLWHVFNRVQENIIKGGFNIGERKARAITNPIADMVLNQGLWQLAEEYAVA
jgi:CBS domain containing-hemolysin-like protein